jgi:hypothetical protein
LISSDLGFGTPCELALRCIDVFKQNFKNEDILELFVKYSG